LYRNLIGFPEGVNPLFDQITLGVSGDTNLIKTRLYNHPECAFPISVAKDDTELPVTYISFEPAGDMRTLDCYLHVVAEYIMERYETKLLRRILEENHKDLSLLQKREVLKSVPLYTDDVIMGYHARKQMILLSLYDYFKEDSLMHLDGFVSFRLKDYEALLEQLAERMVEDCLTRKEYEEFIELLQYFVNMQESRPKCVHICVHPCGGYAIYDAEEKDITAKSFQEFVDEEALLTEEMYDDLLISILITLAPEKVVVHNGSAIRNKELFNTVERVFEGHVTLCPGCHLCT